MPAWLTLILLLLATGVSLAVAVVWLTAINLLRPSRMTTGRALAVLGRADPDDLALPWTHEHFDLIDERTGRPLRLPAWWIPCPQADTTVVMLHGFADAKVGVIAFAAPLRDAGCNLLAVDLRGHGESSGEAASQFTAGTWERFDVRQVLEQWRQRRPQTCRTLILFGASVGGAVAAATAALPDVDLDGLMTDSTPPTFADGAATHMRLLNAPLRGFLPLTLKLAAWLGHADVEVASLLNNLPQVRCPSLQIFGDADPYVPASCWPAITAAAGPRGRQLLVANASHLESYAVSPGDYRQSAAWLVSQARVFSAEKPRDPAHASDSMPPTQVI